MRKIAVVLVAVSALALAACDDKDCFEVDQNNLVEVPNDHCYENAAGDVICKEPAK